MTPRVLDRKNDRGGEGPTTIVLPSVRRSSPFNVVAPARTACVDDRQAHDAQNLVIVTSSRLFAGERVRHVPNRRALMLTKHRWQWHCSANVALSMKPAAVAADACPLSPATCLRPHSARERELLGSLRHFTWAASRSVALLPPRRAQSLENHLHVSTYRLTAFSTASLVRLSRPAPCY